MTSEETDKGNADMPSNDTFRLLSVLLHYPNEAFLSRLDPIAAAGGRLPAGELKTAVERFLVYLGELPPIRLQEIFSAVFDLSPATTLNLAYHAYGDSEKRAVALAGLQRIYDHAGWERITGELPDYLPLLLEFLSVCPEPQTAVPVRQCLQAVATLVAGLEKYAPAYADLLRPLVLMTCTDAGPDGGRNPPLS